MQLNATGTVRHNCAYCIIHKVAWWCNG